MCPLCSTPPTLHGRLLQFVPGFAMDPGATCVLLKTAHTPAHIVLATTPLIFFFVAVALAVVFVRLYIPFLHFFIRQALLVSSELRERVGKNAVKKVAFLFFSFFLLSYRRPQKFAGRGEQLFKYVLTAALQE